MTLYFKLPILYKQKGNNVMSWAISYDSSGPRYIVKYGYVGGAIQTTSTEIKVGKNIGKKNETTAEQQCELEIEALWLKQRDRNGYSETIDAKKPIMPMLAHKYQDYADRLQFPIYVTPKLDGLRCLAFIENKQVKLISRKNKEFEGLDHIKTALSFFPDMILDGELFNNKIGFRNIVSGIKKEGGNKFSNQIEYHIYDIITEKKYKDRIEQIRVLKLQPPLYIVDGPLVNDITGIDQEYKKFIKNGYEGAILRNPDGLYTCDKRSKDLLKYKKFMDREYIITGAKENKGKLANTCVFECVTESGHVFDCMPEGSFEERSQYWQDWKDGKIKKGDLLTVEFFEYTDSTTLKPRFPIGKAIRCDL
jgi:DNA ligase-1